MPDPTQNQNDINSPIVGSPPVQSDPPVVPDFQNTPLQNNSSPTDDFFPPTPTSPPEKKFGKKFVATILGVLLLVAGIGAGIVLVLQPQLLKQEAAQTEYIPDAQCGTGSLGSACASTQIPGSTRCQTASGAKYCCQIGQTIVNNACSGTPTKIMCGGELCNAEDCHCLGGDACTGLSCEPGLAQSCRNQGRAWCDNFKPGDGKTCCVPGYVCGTGSNGGCVPGGGTPKPSSPPGKTPTPRPPTPTPPGQTPTPPPTPTPPGMSAVCSALKAYTSGWTQLSGSQLSVLKPGNNINFCVNGTTNSGSFDKAKFTINGSQQSETTTKRPGTNDYCQSYTIPDGATTFTVTAQIHHATLGWVGP